MEWNGRERIVINAMKEASDMNEINEASGTTEKTKTECQEAIYQWIKRMKYMVHDLMNESTACIITERKTDTIHNEWSGPTANCLN